MSVGQLVSAILLFHGGRADAAGRCDVAARYLLVWPDDQGVAAGNEPTGKQTPLTDGRIQLSQNNPTMAPARREPPGEYTLITEVDEKVAGCTLKVAQTLQFTTHAGR